ncbi:MAG: bifunctional aldolase/short-chain dehydrogenase [Gammaproteobacteria bacterium]|nr:bifunctional aldolase/short-chain dehydrogenase [Gammaproteobacteria bacterium]
MKSLWDDSAAAACKTPLELRAYTSRLLGQSADLVLHGGGNTSVKDTITNLFGEQEEILFVKGSGHDLKTIQTDGFAPSRLGYLQRLAELDELSDTDMMRELKCSMIDPSAPAPSVEAILHAVIPHKYVDHTHTDAVVTLSNTVGGAERIRDVYSDDILILDYVMPGFILAKQVYEATRDLDWSRYRGIILLHHGVFTFSDDAREAYEEMIRIVSQAEDYLAASTEAPQTGGGAEIPAADFARIRHAVSVERGGPVVARYTADGFAQLPNVSDCARRGPVTPDHVLHTKRVPMLLTGNPGADVEAFANEYQRYFDEFAADDLICLDRAPRWAVYPDNGYATFGINGKRLQICNDIVEHTVKCIQWAEQLGGWEALPEKDIFELEYWELEQTKLKKPASGNEFEGRVALVTGAASGIGKATALRLIDEGACVVGLDIDASVAQLSDSVLFKGRVVDLTDTAAVDGALAEAVLHFGGIDILFSNAGSFPPSAPIESTGDDDWSQALELNVDSHFKVLRAAIPYLRVGIAPSVIINASKNVPAPGPGAAAYSAAKAALTQLARVAALELADDRIRVNVLHPDAVFDTGIWTDDVLQARADKYGMSVAEYKRRNLMATEVSAADVAAAVVALADSTFAQSTGLQITIDGGNERTV